MSAIEVTVPDGKSGDWSVESFTVSEKESEFTCMRAACQGSHEYVPPGSYKRLKRGNTVVMSNTPMEVNTHSPIIQNATGHVLINGLGLGMVLNALLAKPDVQSITVVEFSKDVIALTGPSFKDEPRITVVNADAFTYQPPKTMRFNAVWHDIWDTICSDNLPEMQRLHRKYGRRSDWQGSWGRPQCERHHAESKRSCYTW
jgi:hypothetical protein